MKQVMKKLCVLLTLMTLSVGAWAQADYNISTSTWHSGQSDAQNVVKIHINKPGVLSTAIQEVNNNTSYNGFEIIYINCTEGAPLNDDDIESLSTLNYSTIMLSDAYYVPTADSDLASSNAQAFTFSNSRVENLILPDGWTKDDVNACASKVASSNLNGVASLDEGTLVAYLNKPMTLSTILHHTSLTDKANTKIGTINDNTYYVNNLKNITVSGYVTASDLQAGYENVKFDENGHYVFNEPAGENYTGFAGVSGNTREFNGTNELSPTLNHAYDLHTIDLSGAIVEDEWCEDLTLSKLGLLGPSTYKIMIPTYANFNTLPADFLNTRMDNFHSIMIPRNITTIKTRAFQTGNTESIRHIYTEGDDESTAYDNGAVTALAEDGTETKVYGADAETANPIYGTITLGGNLKLIESYAFSSTNRIKDLYVLAIEAPECHVDAFNTTMYVGNDSFDRTAITDGVIIREAYTNSKSEYHWMTLLHYPRECGTPNTQRYTDMSREYSVATGLRDGKGATIYFPNQAEYNRAYLQGTYGYLWNAWDVLRTDDGNNGFANTSIESTVPKTSGWTESGQIAANSTYTSNTNTSTDKTKQTFYDTTGNGSIQKPTGLADYWTITRSGYTLYPQAETEGTGELVDVEDLDENGNRQYVVDEAGEYIKVGTFSLATGTLDPSTTYYVRDYEGTGEYETTNTPNGSETYYSDAAGTTPVTPRVGAGFYYECGTQNVYSDAVYAPVDGVDTYYTKNGDEYTESYIYFDSNNSPRYYNPVTTTEERDKWVKIAQWSKLATGVEHYYQLSNGEYTLFTPQLDKEYFYTTDGTNYQKTSVFIDGVSSYYTVNTDYNVQPYVQYPGDLAEVYTTSDIYYKDGTEIVTNTTYSSSDHWIPEVETWYALQRVSGVQTYVETNQNYYQGTYYYATGSAPKYCSAEGEDYDESVTYYTDNTGATEATSITFDQSYYYEKATYSYRAATDADADKKHYSLTESYVAKETALNEPDEYRYDDKLYSVKMKSVEVQAVTKANDYRGWHQFVLTAFATNSKEEFVPYRSYITDNDWWTICVPFDLTKADLIKLFGKNGSDADADLPYLSKLTYVVRDVENKRIVLTFSKNLLKVKEEVEEGKVHGTIDENKTVGLDDVVLHKGVPYLIRPNLHTDANNKVDADRQFDIYNEAGTRDADLYERILESQTLSGSEQNALIYNGIYTVPAYVINNNGDKKESVSDQATVSFTNGDGSTFSYSNSDKITYQGETTTGDISTDYCYSFVGTFFLSLMPQYSYFLGWTGGETGHAAFWYNKVNDTRNWTWNNETGIIMPNFVTSNQRIADIDPASGLDDPARWIITLKNGDDFASTSSVKNYTNDSQFGFAAPMWKDDATMIIRIDDDSVEQPVNGVKGVFNMNGQFMGNSTDGLQRGIYVVNGKKMVIK